MAEWVPQPVSVRRRARGEQAFAGRTIPRVPTQVLAMIGLTGGCFGLSLAAAAALQSGTDATVAADRAPFASAVDRLTAENDRLEQRLLMLGALDARAADAAGPIGNGIAAMETQLDRLSSTVAAVDGAAQALPARVALPPVVRSVRVGSGSTPAHASTGGSGAP
jgi:hypothetical protein